jgi:hypothetical protein
MRKAGIEGKGAVLGLNLFQKVMNSPSGISVSKDNYEDLWDLMKTPDKKVNLFIPELLDD